MIECIGFNARQSVGECDTGKTCASPESAAANFCHTAGDGDGSEAFASVEGMETNTRHSIGDGDSSKVFAFTECQIANARHAVGNCYIMVAAGVLLQHTVRDYKIFHVAHFSYPPLRYSGRKI